MKHSHHKDKQTSSFSVSAYDLSRAVFYKKLIILHDLYPV